MRIGLLIAALLFAPQDELTLEKLVERMEAKVAPARDLSFTSDATTGGTMAAYVTATFRHEIASRPDGTVRVRGGARSVTARLGAAQPFEPDTELVLLHGAILMRKQVDGRGAGKASPLRAAAMRVPAGAPGIDPLLLENAGYSPEDANLLVLYHLSPRRAIAMEPDLRLLGRRQVGGEEMYVLVSRRKLSDDDDDGDDAMGMMRPQNVVKKLYVGAADFLVKRLEIRFQGGNSWGSYTMSWSAAETTDVGGVPFPSKTVARWGMAAYDDYAMTITHVASGFKRGDPGELADDDLWATAGHRAPDEIDRELAKSPDDPALLFSRVVARSGAFASSALFAGMGDRKAADPASFVPDLEKAVEKRFAPSPVRSLMAILAEAKDVPKLTALLERVGEAENRAPALSLDAAEHWNTLGKHDKALAMLERLSGAPPARVAEERIIAEIGKGDVAAAVKTFRAALAAHPSPMEWAERVLALEGVLPALEKTVEALDGAIAESPKDAALRLARLRAKKDAASAQAALEHAEDARVHDAALALLKEKLDAAKADDAAALFGALEPAIAREKTRGRALAMKGSALLRQGKRDEAKAAFEKGFGPGVPATAELVTQIEELGDDALTERACKAFFEGLKGEGAQAAMMNLWQEKSPLHTLTRMLARQKRHGEFYHAIKGIELGMGIGISIFFTIREDQQEFLKAAGNEAMKDRSELPGLKWLAKSFSGPYASMFGRAGMGVDPVALWEKAREWMPEDLEAAQALVELHADRGEHAKAVKAAEELLKLLEKGVKPGPRGWGRERAHLAVATSLKESGDEEGAKAALAKADLLKAELAPHEIFAAGLLLSAVKQLEPAAAMLSRLEEEGYRPYMHLASIYEKLEKYGEAVRNYNRAIKYGYDDRVSAPGDMYKQVVIPGESGPKKDRSAAPQKAKADLMKKLGENYFIDRLIEGAPAAMTADEESRAKSLVAELSGDELEAREGAIDALRKMGPKTAPVLKAALSSGDDEVRTRVRGLLNEWAEPR